MPLAASHTYIENPFFFREVKVPLEQPLEINIPLFYILQIKNVILVILFKFENVYNIIRTGFGDKSKYFTKNEN